MNKKFKLTNLRHFETSKEEMGLIKGGDEDPERKDWLCSAGCDCTTSCFIEMDNRQEQSGLATNNARSNSALSTVWGAITFGLSRLI
ncbi:MAG: hypothetical protein LBI45_09010 [Bacteroidales bacterium]|nr:hypothetical protein [Bacteroidales bacterium]